MDTQIAKLIELLEKASPLIWETALRQVYIDGITWLVIAMVLATLGCVCFYIHRKNDDWGGGELLFAGSILFVLGTLCLLSSLERFSNPNWAAIQLIMGLVK